MQNYVEKLRMVIKEGGDTLIWIEGIGHFIQLCPFCASKKIILEWNKFVLQLEDIIFFIEKKKWKRNYD